MEDFRIIGGGLAGTILAWKLKEAGARVVLQSSFFAGSGSWAAGALLNPLTGPGLALPQKGMSAYSDSVAFYQYLQNQLGERFFRPMAQLRIFGNEKQQHKIRRNLLKESLTLKGPFPLDPSLRAPWGGTWIKETYHLDPIRFLTTLHRVLKDRNSLVMESWNPSLNRKVPTVLAMGAFDPWAQKYLTPIHGESLLITMDIPKEPLEYVINKGIALIPLEQRLQGQPLYKLGSTYSKDITPQRATRTSKGKEELLNKLSGFWTGSVQVRGHLYGLRPVGPKRSVLWGTHPGNEEYYILNGMGSKGAVYAPYYSDLLVSRLGR